MGQRANLIIVEFQEYSLYYSHWCANTLPNDLFWGADHATNFVREQQPVEKHDWLDDVWAEGGVVIDHDNRVLLLYGGEDLLYDVALRRVFLEMMKRVWSSWDIRWAYEGIVDIAEYVHVPRSKVLSSNRDEVTCSLSPPEEKNWTDIVGSYRFADGELRLFPLAGDIEDYLLTGTRLADSCGQAVGEAILPLDEWLKGEFPAGGFHLDSKSQRLDYWSVEDIPGIPSRVKAKWPGWNVTWHRDEFEFQLVATNNCLRLPVIRKDVLKEQIREMLLREYQQSPVETILKITKSEIGKGKNVEVNPLALRSDRLEIDINERRRIIGIVMDGGHVS